MVDERGFDEEVLKLEVSEPARANALCGRQDSETAKTIKIFT